MLRALEHVLDNHLAVRALELQHNLLGRLRLLVEDGLGLTTIAGLFTIVTTFTLGKNGGFTSLVLGNLVGGVTTALLTGTEGFTSLRNVDLLEYNSEELGRK